MSRAVKLLIFYSMLGTKNPKYKYKQPFIITEFTLQYQYLSE